ncbi:FeoB-associated Cys-rich membrane protein [Thermophagus xiamenensis]|uniref:Virus attachment protein p12 family protein n=1 Tax=Thermophagus xiamenensis TaxID=385682 RepID=A0A1I1VQK1_9BACT|nr:FeoB-associated Cys-rich membrane protein [Thermophagus xiamenensis]SFD85114.1 Virus attachment protein p12 family protein [Thermophagus xiamenensis]
MIQEILTIITVIAAFGYTLYAFYKTMFSKDSSGCGGGCPSCEAKDLLLKDISKKGKKPKFHTFRPLKN